MVAQRFGTIRNTRELRAVPASRKRCSTSRPQCHIIDSPIVHCATSISGSAKRISAILRTTLSDTTTVFNVGRSLDTIVRADGCLRFSLRECIYDREIIPNAIIYPV